MKNRIIIVISVFDRVKEIGRTQKLLSEYSGLIKTRLGFHEVSEDVCSRKGIILLELKGEENEINLFLIKLSEIGGIEVQKMIFDL